MDFIAQSAFSEIAALLLIAAATGFLGNILRQPLIVSFIAVGLVAGQSGLDLVSSDEQIHLLSELGITVLLFLVGIKLDLKLVRSLGLVSLLTGLGQVFFTSIFGYMIALAFGFDHVTSLYMAVALTFSSTIIIVKLLADKGEIDSLHGKIALGFLIVQDLVVVLSMIILSTFGIGADTGDAGSPGSLVSTFLAGAALVGFVAIFIRFIANPLTEKIAHTSELLVIFAIAQATVFATVGDAIGLGKEVGGLLAGVSLASTPFREMIAARLSPLRDFLLLFFFIALGSTLDLSILGTNISAAIVLSLFVLIGNPLIVLVIMGALGYRKRTGFLAGLTVAQISEFSLILITMGISLGHLEQETLGLVTMVGLITIAVSTYMITYSYQLYSLFGPYLELFERKNTPKEPNGVDLHSRKGHDVIIFGLGRFGTAIGVRLKKKGLSVLGIDFNPQAVRRWKRLGLNSAFGDATDPQFIAELPFQKTKWLVSTIPEPPLVLSDESSNRAFIQHSKIKSYKGKVAVTSHHSSNTEDLSNTGVDLIIEPYQDAADRTVDLICSGKKKERTEIPSLNS